MEGGGDCDSISQSVTLALWAELQGGRVGVGIVAWSTWLASPSVEMPPLSEFG